MNTTQKLRCLLVLGILFYFFQQNSFAQGEVKDNSYPSFRYGAKLGLAYRTSIAFGGDDSVLLSQWEPTSGIVIGGTTEILFAKKFGLQVDAVFTQRGFHTRPLADYKQTYSIIHIPMMLKFANMENISFLQGLISDDLFDIGVGVGPTFGYTLGAHAKSGSQREKLNLKEMDMKRNHWGATLALMVDFNILEKHRVGFHTSANFGFTDFDKDPDFKQFFRAYDFALVYYIN